MTDIPVKNIYYMLAYAIGSLDRAEYRKIEGEVFHDAYDLLAAIIVKGVSKQLKQGLHKEYVGKTEDMQTVRGRLVMHDIMRHEMAHRRMLTCDHD